MMAKTLPVSFRLEQDVKEALDAAARADNRSTSSLMTLIITDWQAGKLRALDLDAEVEAGLAACAAKTERPQEWIIGKAVAQFLRDRGYLAKDDQPS